MMRDDCVCVIVGAMPEPELYIPSNAYVIAADGGFEQLQKIGIEPDITVGDFDSLGYVPDVKNVVQHPVQKDDTDMLLAIRIGLEKGYKKFVLYGGVGGRIDHTLANIQTLKFLSEHGAKGFLYGDHTALTVVQDDSISFPDSLSGTISVFSLSDCSLGVYEKGLLYELENAELTNSFPLGVSNSFCGSNSFVSVSDGTLLISWTTSARDLFDII